MKYYKKFSADNSPKQDNNFQLSFYARVSKRPANLEFSTV